MSRLKDTSIGDLRTPICGDPMADTHPDGFGVS